MFVQELIQPVDSDPPPPLSPGAHILNKERQPNTSRELLQTRQDPQQQKLGCRRGWQRSFSWNFPSGCSQSGASHSGRRQRLWEGRPAPGADGLPGTQPWEAGSLPIKPWDEQDTELLRMCKLHYTCNALITSHGFSSPTKNSFPISSLLRQPASLGPSLLVCEVGIIQQLPPVGDRAVR
jgi:hypothetical protein